MLNLTNKPIFYVFSSYLVFIFLPFYKIHGIYKPYQGNIVKDVKRFNIITQGQFSMFKVFKLTHNCSSNLYQALPQTIKYYSMICIFHNERYSCTLIRLNMRSIQMLTLYFIHFKVP